MIWALFLPDKMHHLSLLTLKILILRSAHTPWLPAESPHLPGIFFPPLKSFPGSCGPGTCTINSCLWFIFKPVNQANYMVECFILTELFYRFLSLLACYGPSLSPDPTSCTTKRKLLSNSCLLDQRAVYPGLTTLCVRPNLPLPNLP